jgi:hypothetical protein
MRERPLRPKGGVRRCGKQIEAKACEVNDAARPKCKKSKPINDFSLS